MHQISMGEFILVNGAVRDFGYLLGFGALAFVPLSLVT